MTPMDVRKALENLPKGLEETYKQILLAIDKEKQEAEVARRALTWLIAAFSPLRLSQIVEALSIDLNQRILNPDLAPLHGSALLDALSSLVTHDEETDIVILSHFSVHVRFKHCSLRLCGLTAMAQEYLTGELAHTGLSAYRINPQYAEGQLAQFCMCYIAACLNQRQGFGGNRSPSHTTHGGWLDLDSVELSRTVGYRATASPSLESQPLLEYVLSHTFDHLAHVDSENKAVLRALVALEADVRRNPLTWEHLCTERNSSFAWPTSKDDFVFYALVAFATEPLLRSFLGRSQVNPKTGTNPLVYAAQLDKAAHARTLLSRGAPLNRSGLLASRRSRQVTPLEAAVLYKSSAVVNLLLMEGSPVPQKVFGDVVKAEYLENVAGARIGARLLQTDDFAEWALEAPDGPPFLGFLSDLDYTHHHVVDSELWPNDEDIVTILRRLVQLGCDPFTHRSSLQHLFHQATAAGHISTVKYMLSLDIPPPPDILLCIPCTVRRRFLPSSPMLRLLLNNGVDSRAATANEDTALHVAIDSDISEDDCLERIKLLIGAGCDPSANNLFGETPLWLAASRGFISVVQYMLSRGALRPCDILLSVSRIQLKKAPMVRYLICTGADSDVFVAADDGNTVLHLILDCSPEGHQGTEEDCLESTRILIDAGCNPCIANSVGDTPMDVALQTGHVLVVKYFLTLNLPLPPDALLKASRTRFFSPNSSQMIKMLVEKRVDMNVASPDGDNALHLAVARYISGYLEETVKLLVEAGCDATACNSVGQTPMHLATKYEHKSIVAYFLSRGVPLPHDIMLVGTTGKLYTLFIEQGADPRVIAKNGDTVLHGVVDKVFPQSDALKLTRALIRAGCNPSTLNSAGETPLQVAVRRGYVSVIEYLLSLNVSPLPSDILLTASRPRLPIFRNSGVQTIRFLVEKGAATNVVTGNGDSALHLALSSHFHKDDDALNVAKILIDAGCEPQTQNLAGETALYAAAKGGHLASMEYLILQGVPFNSDILLASAMANWPSCKSTIMRFLISKGADIRAVTASGDTALHLTLGCSFEATRLETARILVDSGSDPSQPNLAGKTPLHIAASSGFPPLVKYLRSRNVPLPSDILLSASAAALGIPRDRLREAPRITQMFRLLIREGANVNVLAQNGDTLLHTAFRQSLKSAHTGTTPWKLIGILLRAGCDPWGCNADGQTPFDLAEEQGHFFHNNFQRLVDTYRGSDRNRSDALEPSSSKRQAEEMDLDMTRQLTKRGRFDDIRDEDEIAEVDEELMA